MLIVKQYHFVSWPGMSIVSNEFRERERETDVILDHGGLALSTPLLDFRQRFRSEYKPSGPILVHCRLN